MSSTDFDNTLSIYYLGEWTGAFARRSNKRVVYTPFLSSVTSENWHERVTLQEKDLFNNKNYPLFLEENYFSKHLNASGKVSYQPWTSAMRTNHLTSLKTEKTL